MTTDRAFDRGLLAGALLMIGADGLHWFLTPQPGVTDLRTALVVVQVVAGIGGGLWLLRKRLFGRAAA